jgi:hypothetical protein
MSSSPSNISQRYQERSSFDIRGIHPSHVQSKQPDPDVLFVEKNLLAMGDEVRRETGTDVFKSDPQLNEWMQRVKKLGGATDVDDDERSKRLEEVNNLPANDINWQEIMAQRKARKERREGNYLDWILY